MKNHKYNLAGIGLLLVYLFCLGIVGSTSAQAAEPISDGTPSLEETALLDLINQARKDPMLMAASMGLDPEKILRDLPALSEILTKGLPPLDFDRKLYRAARGHAEDMLVNNYYSHYSPDGRSYDDRIRDAEYVPLSTGESLGFLAFNNFIEPGYAVQVIFEKMYKEELDPAGTGPRNILNPDLREAGIAIVAGIFETSDAPLNAYIAVADFADSFDLYAVEKGLWRLVNEARRWPLKALDALKIDEAGAREALGEDAWILDQGLPPLAWNEKLEASALAHYSDMVTLGYYSTHSPDGSTPAERIASTGYQAALAGEALGYASFYGPSDPAEVARVIYESMLRAELSPDTAVEKFIFDPHPKEIGFACGKFYLAAQDGQEGVAFVVVADFALPSDPGVFMLGNIYEDLNGDTIYSPGEGVEGFTISLGAYDDEGLVEVRTDALGNYQLEIVKDFPKVTVRDNSGKLIAGSKLFWTENYSLLMDIRVEIADVAATEKKTGSAYDSTVPSMAITW